VAAVRVDGNDALAVHRVLAGALATARDGGGPTLVEALTYRLDGHTNADDPGRYRDAQEVARWRERDPVVLLERHLRAMGELDDATAAEAHADAEDLAADLRARLGAEPAADPMELFDHVYARPAPHLEEQRRTLAAEAGP
jgi:pyruvate dehydrogenase E1 component alpha subunit